MKTFVVVLIFFSTYCMVIGQNVPLFDHSISASAGVTQPFDPTDKNVGIYDQIYKSSYILKGNYNLSIKYLSLGFQAAYFNGRLIETEHIIYDGQSIGASVTFPISLRYYSYRNMEYYIYAAVGFTQFVTPELTRLKFLGGQPDNTTFPSTVETLIAADVGLRVRYYLPHQFFVVGSLNYQANGNIFSTDVHLPQLTLGFGYKII